jgi:hypothetical protein
MEISKCLQTWIEIQSKEDELEPQNDLEKLGTWTKNWLLKFNANESKVMLISHKLDAKYYLTL